MIMKRLRKRKLKIKMVLLKFQCLNCKEMFDFDVGSAKFISKTKLEQEKLTICPKCNENQTKKLKTIQTSELEKLYTEYTEKAIRRQAIRRFKPGMLIAYPNIFGSDKQIELSIWGEKYTLIDLYCVNPFCKCENVYLNFFDQNCKKHVHYPKFAFQINYESGEIKETESISEWKAYETIEKFMQDLDLFKKRHEELKKEVQPYILKKFKNYFIPTRKLGRNEQCHCGSGKKYKKCCLERDTKKYGRRIRVPA